MKKILPILISLSFLFLALSSCKNERRQAAAEAATAEKTAQDLAAQLEAQRADSITQANAAAEAAEREKSLAAEVEKETKAKADAAKKATTKPATTAKPAPKKPTTTTSTTKPKPKPAPKPTTPTAPKQESQGTLLGGTADQFDNPSNVIKRTGKDDVLTISDVKPSYPGGEAAMMKFLSKNIKYPAVARDNGIKGTVYVKFVVEKNGDVTDVTVAKGVHPTLDAEAKRVVNAMPNWAAGKQAGQPVAVQYTLPVKFELVD